MTGADHDAAVRLLKTMEPGTDIALILYRESTFYTQPPISSDVTMMKPNGHVMNANSNNASGIDDVITPAPTSVLVTQTDGDVINEPEPELTSSVQVEEEEEEEPFIEVRFEFFDL